MRVSLRDVPTRQFYLVLVGVIAIVGAGAASLLTVPQFKRLDRARSAAAAAPAPVTDLATLGARLRERDAQTLALSQTMHGDRANLPEREIEAFVIDRLQANAWQHNVALQGVEPRSGESIEHFHELIFQLTLTGQYRDLFSWLHQLRADLGFVVIKELRLTPANIDPINPLLQADVTLASYRREQP